MQTKPAGADSDGGAEQAKERVLLLLARAEEAETKKKKKKEAEKKKQKKQMKRPRSKFSVGAVGDSCCTGGAGVTAGFVRQGRQAVPEAVLTYALLTGGG
jgi:hypothetical protein